MDDFETAMRNRYYNIYNDEAKEKLRKIIFEEEIGEKGISNIRQEPIKKEIIQVSDIKITPEMEVEPECLEYLIPKSQEHKDSFFRILLKTAFENDAERIYQGLGRIKYSDIQVLSESIRKNKLRYFQNRLDIAKLLFVLKTETNGIYMKNVKYECLLPSPIQNELEEKIEEKYKNMELDLIPMTYEEAEDKLSAAFAFPEYDSEGATEWLCEYLNLTLDEFLYYCRDDSPTDDMIEAYSEENFIPCEEITPLQIKNTINELQDGIRKYSRKGRPQKNERIYAALSIFVDCGFKATNKQFKTIYECLDYFGFIDNDVKKGWNKSQKYPEIQYVKSIYTQSRKFKVIFKDEEKSLSF